MVEFAGNAIYSYTVDNVLNTCAVASDYTAMTHDTIIYSNVLTSVEQQL